MDPCNYPGPLPKFRPLNGRNRIDPPKFTTPKIKTRQRDEVGELTAAEDHFSPYKKGFKTAHRDLDHQSPLLRGQRPEPLSPNQPLPHKHPEAPCIPEPPHK